MGVTCLYTPTDVAFSVLKDKEDVRKFLPLIIPAAAAIYGGYKGYTNVRDNKITDPVFGTELAEGDDSFLSNLGEFGTGVAQGFGAGAGAKVLARRGGKKLATRRAGKHAIAQREAAAASAKHAGMSAQQQQAMLQAQNPGIVFGRTVQTLPPSQVGAARTAAQQAGAKASRLASPGIGSRSLTALGQPMNRTGLGFLGGGLATGAGLAYAGHQIADALGAGGGGSGMGGGGSGMGGQQHQQGQFNLAGQQSGGVQNLQNVGVGQGERRKIWQDGGAGTFDQTQKGEIMTFTNREGNEMLYKTLNELDKMHCGTEQKAECPKCGKNCKCDEEKKADDGDKKKKPAHGMVIVIGSKNSGPGPSTEGKRDSKD